MVMMMTTVAVVDDGNDIGDISQGFGCFFDVY